VLILSIVLAIAPLLGVAYVLTGGEGVTVDSLFTILILLAISGVFGLNVLLILRGRKKERDAPAGRQSQASGSAAGLVQTARGLVESVLFFESPVGQADKSLVTLRANGAKSVRMLPFEGDLRNLLPVGKKVELKYHAEAGVARILALEYR
jgi:hypothetical protein